jgi:hypothetical protein
LPHRHHQIPRLNISMIDSRSEWILNACANPRAFSLRSQYSDLIEPRAKYWWRLSAARIANQKSS